MCRDTCEIAYNNIMKDQRGGGGERRRPIDRDHVCKGHNQCWTNIGDGCS